MHPDETYTLALTALSYIFENEHLGSRFLNMSGFDEMTLKARASDSEDTAFQLGILDYFMGFEPDLVALCEHKNIRPEHVVKAWIALGGDPQML
ncbi:DUF3572 family protein [Temperatibacter marinus]|uniref:DUF3572 family protein n=1 Tax=Temperatibacter marinus TaxID=1456591 RepID=A0AA52EGQ3_9PROT|nr:DUF3572 family protein [Temperatibacter marinus]WND02470.1 DUF3572 family protein [Temperatibacter marinus]